jgi:hypothetical protein
MKINNVFVLILAFQKAELQINVAAGYSRNFGDSAATCLKV